MKIALSAAALVAGLCLSTPQLAAAQDTAAGKQASEQQIRALIDAYRKAVVNKDIPGFMKLFVRDDITWTGAYTDASLARQNAKRTDPQAPPAKKVSSDSPRKFIESLAKSKEAKSETFSNVRIDTDGDIAQVWFDYTFMTGDYKNNWGKESWQLVRTEDGWKIAGVVWSSETNPVPR